MRELRRGGHAPFEGASACPVSSACPVVQRTKPLCVNFQCGVAAASDKNFTAKTLQHGSQQACSLPPFGTADVGG